MFGYCNCWVFNWFVDRVFVGNGGVDSIFVFCILGYIVIVFFYCWFVVWVGFLGGLVCVGWVILVGVEWVLVLVRV